MVDFAQLKKNRLSNLEQLTEKLQATQQAKQDYSDDRMWYPKTDKAGNGYAVIRFLPAPPKEDLPWVKVFSHGFQGPGGKWFIENCPTTVGRECPVCNSNSDHWNSGTEAGKQIARNRKRRLTYIANVYIVEDPASPENAGKVFLFKFGKRIFDKLTVAINPEFPDEKPINPFDFWEGANFKFKIRKVDGNTNYDKSEFESPSALLEGDDKKLEAIWNQEHSLQEFVSADKFLTNEELQQKFDKVIGSRASTVETAEDLPVKDYTNKSKPAEEDPINKTPSLEIEADGDEVDLDYFKKIANQ